MSFEIDKAFVGGGLSAADHTNIMLSYWDKDLICRYANKAYVDWFGVEPENLIDKIHLRTFLGRSYEQYLDEINAALAGKTCVFERYATLVNGQTKKIRVYYFPDISEGEVMGFYVNVLDVSTLNKESVAPNAFDHTINYARPAKDMLDDVIDDLRSHLFDGFPGIRLLARKNYISESKLKRDFKERYRETIFGYYRNLQMELAREYITAKKANKGQMANMLGFSNPSNFSACYHKYIDDLAAKRQMEERNVRNDEKYQAFVSQLPFPIAMVDNKLCFLITSGKFIADQKLQHKGHIGKCIYDVCPGSKEMYQSKFNACLKGGIDQSSGDIVKNADGSFRWMRWDIRPWYKQDKSIGGLIIYIEDIAEAKLKKKQFKEGPQAKGARNSAWSLIKPNSDITPQGWA